MRGSGLKLHQGRFRLDIGKSFFTKRDNQALEQCTKGSGWVTIAGGVQKKCRRGTWLVVDLAVLGWLDSILKVFSDLNDSMILWDVLSLWCYSWDQCERCFTYMFGSSVHFQRESTCFWFFPHPSNGCCKATVISKKILRRKKRSEDRDCLCFLICVFMVQRFC